MNENEELMTDHGGVCVQDEVAMCKTLPNKKEKHKRTRVLRVRAKCVVRPLMDFICTALCVRAKVLDVNA